MGLRRRDNEQTVFSMIADSEPAFSEQHLKTIKNKLKQVMWLCRLFNKNVEIVYECDRSGIQKVMTKVWLTTSKNILLKNGISIPAKSIKEVRVL